MYSDRRRLSRCGRGILREADCAVVGGREAAREGIIVSQCNRE